MRYLTLATKNRQKEWLALFNNPDTYALHRGQLKACLLGGQSIPTKAALFATYAGQIVADPFGEESYFADADTRRLPGASSLSRCRMVRCHCSGRQSLFPFLGVREDAEEEGRHSPPVIGLTPSATSFAVSPLLSPERRTKNGAHLNTTVRSLHHTFAWVKSWQHLPQDHSVKEQRTTQTRMSRVPYRQAEI
ncbi:MAG TPA: hypothetical protein VGX71_10325 [Pseudaminobacter sp.]|nr:hypothetical protein [Pseudaminobacter sp.]